MGCDVHPGGQGVTSILGGREVTSILGRSDIHPGEPGGVMSVLGGQWGVMSILGGGGVDVHPGGARG